MFGGVTSIGKLCRNKKLPVINLFTTEEFRHCVDQGRLENCETNKKGRPERGGNPFIFHATVKSPKGYDQSENGIRKNSNQD